MGGAPKPEEQPKQSCCLGVLYYSTALQHKGRRPVCVGIPHRPGSQVQLEDRSQVTDGYTDFKFLCVGYSVFEHQRRAAQAAQAAGAHDIVPPMPPKLPYCEGIEAVMAVPREADSEAATAASSSSQGDADLAAAAAATATATQPVPWRPAAQEQRRQSLLGGLASMLGGSDDAENELAKFAEKFMKVAQRNLDKMKSTASGAFKSLMDRDTDD